MNKSFEALETERALRATAALPAPEAPSVELVPAAPPGFPRPVFEAPSKAIKRGVDRSNRVETQLVSLFDPRSFEAEQYRMLRHFVETLRKGGNLQVVAVTSSGVGDGKTTTAINLAGALAQSVDARVLLVDIDIRRPAVAHRLGLASSKRSLVGTLLDARLTLKDTVEHLAHLNLSVLPAGGPALAPYEVLKSPRLGALLDEARECYDYIVLDTPPFVPVPDCRIIEKYIDGFLLVVKAHRTPRGELARALDLMDPAKVAGLVFNDDRVRRSSYYDVYAEPPRSPRRHLWRRP
jgi:capsular exopolysaccharide synthesis family protein